MVEWGRRSHPWKPRVHHVAERYRCSLRLPPPRIWNMRVKLERYDLAGIFIFDSAQELPRYAKGRRHDAAGVARMHPLAQNLNLQRAAYETAQRRRTPKLIVIGAARIQ